MTLGGRRVNLGALRDVALMTVEGERDDITGQGQTHAAIDLCTGLDDRLKFAFTQEKVGHYGVFNGNRFRHSVRPRMRDFIVAHRRTVRGSAAAA